MAAERTRDEHPAVTWLRDVLDEIGSQPAASNPRQCVAHHDAHPSLSLFSRKDGTGAGLKCHSGCTLDELLKALRMPRLWLHQPPDISPNQHVQRNRLTDNLTFPALDPDTGRHPAARGMHLETVHKYGGGKWLLERWRAKSGDKHLLWQTDTGNGTVPGLRDVPADGLPLYNEPDIKAAIALGEPVILVESESSADTLTRHGHYATTWAGGATHIPTSRLQIVLEGYDKLIVIPDNDDAGLKALQRLRDNNLAPHVLMPSPGHDARDLHTRLGKEKFNSALTSAFSASTADTIDAQLAAAKCQPTHPATATPRRPDRAAVNPSTTRPPRTQAADRVTASHPDLSR